MIYDSSEFRYEMVSELEKQEDGILLFRDDGNDSILRKISQEDSSVHIEYMDAKPVYFVPVKYNMDDRTGYHVDAKDFIINLLYKRWAEKQNDKTENRRLRINPYANPYTCHRFMEYITKTTGITRSDYILASMPEEPEK